MGLIRIGNQVISPLILGSTGGVGGSIYIIGIYATAPVVATSGSRYYNSTTKKVYISDGTSWSSSEELQLDTLYMCTSDEKIYYVKDSTLAQASVGANGLLYDKEILYLTQDGVAISEGIHIVGGGAGETFALTNNLTSATYAIPTGAPFTIDYTYLSKYGTSATVDYIINGLTKKSTVITDGTYQYDISTYLVTGDNTINIKVTDTYGTIKTLLISVTVVQLTMSSTFDSASVYNTDISFKYTPVGNLSKNIYYELDGVTSEPEIVTTSGRQITKIISGLTHGVHTFKVWATGTVDNTVVTSNILNYEIMYIEEGNSTVLIASEFNKTNFVQGELVSIPYSVYNPSNTESTITLSINNVSQGDFNVPRTRQYWNNYIQEIGNVTYTITCGLVSRTFSIEVTELAIDVEPVIENMQLFLSSKNRSNAETNKNKWEYNGITTSFSGFNWVTDGWIQDKDYLTSLRLANTARAEINFKPFMEDFRLNGKTIEIEFAVRDIIEETAVIMSCMSAGRGFQLTGQNISLNSEQSSTSIKFKENERIRISFVIEALSDHRLLRTYVDGVLSGVKQYPTDDDFSQSTPVNILLGSSSCTLDVYTIRVYNTALPITDILNNYIGDTVNVNSKLSLYSKNSVYNDYGNILYNKVVQQLPCMIITGPLPTYKGDKKKVQVDYENAQDSSRNFNRTNVTIDIQGTSSQYYPKKNYKISKFSTAYALRATSIPETAFTCKTDYMESSHAHNTGIAKIVHTLYDDKVPPQLVDSRVRTVVDGFPIAMFYRPTLADPLEYYGVFNFNNDKGNNTTYGFTAGCESWEFKNNTAARCLFKSDDFSDPIAVFNDLEARYPDPFTDFTNISRLVSWVISCDKDKATNEAIEPTIVDDITYTVDSAEYRKAKFKAEYESHFNKNYLLTYYIVAEFLGMIDSRAKNMFLNTYDGNIWFPVFYDMDTAMGLNNEGVNNFGYNIEFHDTIGTLNVYNGEGSALWNMVEATLYDDIQVLYNELRGDGRLSYESFMAKFYGEQVSKICEAQYNTEAEFKYLMPLFKDNISSYLYCAQGNRIYHIEWWLYNRFKYMDSKYTAAAYSEQYLTMRLYTPSTWQDVAPNAAFNITPAMDEYVTVQYASYIVRKRGYKGQVSNMPAPAITFNDTETIIYGADKISDIGDLSPLYAGSIDVSKAVKLTSLKVGAGGNYTNTNLTHLSLGNNILLTTIDTRNCPNLSGPMDVSGCTSIASIDVTGTSLTSVKLPSAGALTKLYLPSTITNLTIKNQLNLTDFYMQDYNSITTLCLENTCLDTQSIYNLCTNLSKVRITKAAWTTNDITILDKIYNMSGVDENGYNTAHGVITGTLYIGIPMLESTIQRYSAKFIGLNITAVEYIAEDVMYSDAGEALALSDGTNLIYSEIIS